MLFAHNIFNSAAKVNANKIANDGFCEGIEVAFGLLRFYVKR